MKQKKLTWAAIIDDDALLVKMWNSFALRDEEVAEEGSQYGYVYMKIYPNTFDNVMKVYDNNATKFLKDNLSFWDGGGNSGYIFGDAWFRANESSSGECYLTSDNDAIYLIELIVLDRFGDPENNPVMDRFKQYCIKHQDEFKEKEA